MGLFRTDPVDLSDERLMELVVRGDERAFTVLYDRYQRKLLPTSTACPGMDRERSQDFLQDLFTRSRRSRRAIIRASLPHVVVQRGQ